MKKLILVVILIGVFLAGISTGPAFSQTTTINFDTRFPNCSPDSADDLPVPPDLYRDLGVLFSAINPDGTQAYIWGVCGIPSVLDPPYEGGVFSLPNAIKGWRSSTYPVVADFVVPNTNEPGITSYVKVGVSSGPGPGILSVEPDGSPAVRLEAYDIDGNLIAVDFANPPPEYNNQFDYLEVSQPNIARVIMIVGLYRETFDDFEFSPVTPVECTGDAQCDDGEYCNGAEICVAGICEPGTDPCDPQTEVCDEENDVCAPKGPAFTDVPPGYWAEEFIYKIYNAGITSGCSQNPLMYCPENAVNRSQMAVFLERGIHGSDFDPPPAGGIFDDVPVSHPAADFIEQFYSDGITSGCSTSPLMYCPNEPVTRRQMAVFLLRAKHGSGYTPPAASGIFDDVPVSHPTAAWIEQLYNEGITSGCSDSPMLYCPDRSVTRAQMAVFIVRTFGL